MATNITSQQVNTSFDSHFAPSNFSTRKTESLVLMTTLGLFCSQNLIGIDAFKPIPEAMEQIKAKIYALFFTNTSSLNDLMRNMLDTSKHHVIGNALHLPRKDCNTWSSFFNDKTSQFLDGTLETLKHWFMATRVVALETNAQQQTELSLKISEMSQLQLGISTHRPTFSEALCEKEKFTDLRTLDLYIADLKLRTNLKTMFSESLTTIRAAHSDTKVPISTETKAGNSLDTEINNIKTSFYQTLIYKWQDGIAFSTSEKDLQAITQLMKDLKALTPSKGPINPDITQLQEDIKRQMHRLRFETLLTKRNESEMNLGTFNDYFSSAVSKDRLYKSNTAFVKAVLKGHVERVQFKILYLKEKIRKVLKQANSKFKTFQNAALPNELEAVQEAVERFVQKTAPSLREQRIDLINAQQGFEEDLRNLFATARWAIKITTKSQPTANLFKDLEQSYSDAIKLLGETANEIALFLEPRAKQI